tara:strand:+ start:28281 stop:28499 length:219 start_codon:yes stop_codon:yes gene_type:complete
MPKSKEYDAISGFEGTKYAFDFTTVDGKLYLQGIWKDGDPLDPRLEEWTSIKDSDEALSAYNIFANGIAEES